MTNYELKMPIVDTVKKINSFVPDMGSTKK